eukprot:764071-Hanusia_phi.AAC.2
MHSEKKSDSVKYCNRHQSKGNDMASLNMWSNCVDHVSPSRKEGLREETMNGKSMAGVRLFSLRVGLAGNKS